MHRRRLLAAAASLAAAPAFAQHSHPLTPAAPAADAFHR
ncbi:MAG: hypothetical protein JWP04_248, partial [Belnapia sp.]|nr:hypothetical protein [Belnapia sp.]